MRTVTAGELRGRLGEMLDAASGGERITIERDRRPLAVIVSIEDAQRLDGPDETRARQLAALDRLDRFAQRMARDYPAPADGFRDSADWIRWDRDHGHGEHG